MALSFDLAAIPLKYVAFPVVAGLAAGTGALAAYITSPAPAAAAKEPAAVVAALPVHTMPSTPTVTTEQITPVKPAKKLSCEEQTWPYIDNRCIARKGDKGAEPVRTVRVGKPVAILRLSGIYGPGQNALIQVSRGSAKRIAKPGQVFNRIHVEDIAQAIDAAFTQRADGIFNVTDDEPTPQDVPIAFAAELLGVAPPPQIPFADAAKSMSSMALSFYAESKRVRNDKLKRELGLRLRYPTYVEGLRALAARDRSIPR